MDCGFGPGEGSGGFVVGGVLNGSMLVKLVPLSDLPARMENQHST